MLFVDCCILVGWIVVFVHVFAMSPQTVELSALCVYVAQFCAVGAPSAYVLDVPVFAQYASYVVGTCIMIFDNHVV